MTCRMLRSRGASFVRFAAVAMMVTASAPAIAQTPGGAQAPAMPQMNMADQRGMVQGTVTNEAKAPVAGATVTATNADTGAQFTATTDAQGTYHFGALPPGKYDIAIVSPTGVMTFRRTGVEVVTDRTASLD